MTESKDNPLYYFSKLIESDTLKIQSDRALNEFKDYAGEYLKSIDYDKGIIKFWQFDNFHTIDDKKMELGTYSFKESFPKIINKESKLTKNKIDDIVLEINMNGNNANQFLITQVKQLNILFEKSSKKFPEHKFIENSISNIITYLVDKYSLASLDTREASLHFNNKKVNQSSNSSEAALTSQDTNLSGQNQSTIKFNKGEERELINAIFLFMKGLNEKREKIMSEEQYALMNQHILFLVDKGKIPAIESKLNPLNISNDLLSFTFWVLHEQLYTTKKIKPYFVEFLKHTFLNFDNKEISSIKKGFGTRSRVTKDLFLPEIIIQYL